MNDGVVKLNVLSKRMKMIPILNIIADTIRKNQERIILAQQGQLFSGINSSGQEIVPEYTSLTKFLKAEKGQPFDRVTLLDTGAFYNAFEVEVFEDAFTIENMDEKRDQLVSKYGADIIGLTLESIEQLSQEYFKDDMREGIRKYLMVA